MGTSIELELDGISLDYAKNHMGVDHGQLFQKEDRDRRRSGTIDYDSVHDDLSDDELAGYEAAFVRPLHRVLPRLDLLGFTLDFARREYDNIVAEQVELSSSDYRDNRAASDYMSFDEFCYFCDRFRISELDDKYIDHQDRNEEERLIKGRFFQLRKDIERIPKDPLRDDLYWSERSFFGNSVCILSAYSMLQVFGRGETNRDAEVMWQYGPIVEAGWVSLDAFHAGIRRTDSLLVATEGTSDARILLRAIDVLQPDVADFFRFIDVDQGHPFPGTGNLVKFAGGLVHIDVQNRIVFVLDNDAEGLAGLRRIEAMSKPVNMRALVLPALEAFRHFPARGPEGVNETDINERAAAIECYLDLNLRGRPAPIVVWSSYKNEVDRWQGSLEHKETYTRRFFNQSDAALLDGSYQTDKLQAVLNAIIAEAIQLAQEDRSAKAFPA